MKSSIICIMLTLACTFLLFPPSTNAATLDTINDVSPIKIWTHGSTKVTSSTKTANFYVGKTGKQWLDIIASCSNDLSNYHVELYKADGTKVGGWINTNCSSVPIKWTEAFYVPSKGNYYFRFDDGTAGTVNIHAYVFTYNPIHDAMFPIELPEPIQKVVYDLYAEIAKLLPSS